MADLARQPLLGLDESMAGHRLSVWLQQVAPGVPLAARTNSILGLAAAAKAGVGVAALPIALGDAEPDPRRVLPPVPELTRAWRLLVHPDARHEPRVEAFSDFVAVEGEAMRAILTG